MDEAGKKSAASDSCEIGGGREAEAAAGALPLAGWLVGWLLALTSTPSHTSSGADGDRLSNSLLLRRKSRKAPSELAAALRSVEVRTAIGKGEGEGGREGVRA